MQRVLLVTVFACGLMLGAAGGFAQQTGGSQPPAGTQAAPTQTTPTRQTTPTTQTAPAQTAPTTQPGGKKTEGNAESGKAAPKSAGGEKKELTKQQKRMKDCNAEAKAKGFKGDQRKQFMSGCLKSE